MRSIAFLLSCGALLVGCGAQTGPGRQSPTPLDSVVAAGSRATAVTRATSHVISSTGRDLGTLMISDSGRTLSIMGTLRGLPPGVHGVHFHTVGKCDAPAFTTAGDHWNPTSKQHGIENPLGPHLGDLQNITVGADSTADVRVATTGGSLSGTNAMLGAAGAALVVHASVDDYKTDPSGNSGGRIACGVIGRS